jgi:hypothetical protein
VLAAVVSYKLGLNSIDYTLKKYVDTELYNAVPESYGDDVSEFIKDSIDLLERDLYKLHKDDPRVGVFGAEISLFRLPHSLNIARMLSNRGFLLEVAPLLRTCLEIIAWSSAAFHIVDENKIRNLKASRCIKKLNGFYRSSGEIYGYLSTFSHWSQIIHKEFVDILDNRAVVFKASVNFRAISLALCLVILDMMVEVVRYLYQENGEEIVIGVQGTLCRDSKRRCYQFLSGIAELTKLDDLYRLQDLMLLA